MAASQWVFSAKIENKMTRNRLEFSGTVSPLDQSLDQVIETGDCLQMNKKNMDKLTVLENGVTHAKIEFKVFK